MAYRFNPDEGVRKAVRRCAREQLDDAVRQLSTEIEHDPGGAVHEARKSIKKSRALLRLMRGALASERRSGENAALRDAARRLSAARDTHVLIGTVDRLADTYAGQVPERTFRAIRDKLDPAQEGAAEIVPSAEVARALVAAHARIDDWELSRGGWRALGPGLSRTYRRGRKALRRAREDPSLENLHEWRKRVKDLWYDLRLLQPVSGPAVRGKAKKADQLADLLGDDHDLGVLEETVIATSGELAVDVDALLALIAHRRRELQEQAIAIGERLYADPPKTFKRRLHRHWSAGRARARGVREQGPADLAAASRSPHPVA